MKSPTRLDNRNGTHMHRFAHRLSIVLALAACAILQQAQTVAHAATLRTVALSGQQAPGKPDGTTFTSFLPFSPLVLNDAGQTAFWARTSDSIFSSGIWSEGAGSLNLVAEPGQQASGLPEGVTYDTFYINSSRIVISDAGITAFNGSSGGSAGNQGIWSSGPGSSALIARVGEQATGVPAGVVYAALDFGIPAFVLNDAGQAAFSAYLTGSGVDLSNRNGIWAQRHGNLELVARQGNHAPGTPDGVNFGNFWPGLALNKFGQTAFGGFLTGSGVDATNDWGLWSEGSGSLKLVARSGSQAPGMPDGAVFTGGFGLFGPAFNNAGQTAFVNFVTGGGVDATNDYGIWSESSGSLALVAREGDQAPGTPSGVNFGNFSETPLNDAGEIAFTASLAGAGVDSTNNRGLWSGAPGSLALVARTGDHAPGTEDGVVFRSFTNVVSNTGPSWMFNAAGQTAFNAQLIGSDGVSAGSGIWATDRSGVLQLVARRGDLLEVAPGDFRTTTGVTFLVDRFTNPTGNSDGRPSAFNNLGQLAFYAGFTDGTFGVFVSNRVAIPEPSAISTILMGTLCLNFHRRRNRS
jgi:hypothetical protein